MLTGKYLFLAACFLSCIYFSASSASENDDEEEQELIQNNYDKWTKLFLDWLTDEQKAELNDMKKEGDSLEDFHATVMIYYDSVKGDPLWTVNEALNRACLTFVDYLTQPSRFYVNEFERIARMAYDPYTKDENKNFVERSKQRLKDKVDQVINFTTDVKKKKLARKYVPSCVKVFLSSYHMVRYYNDNFEREKYLVKDTDINNWARRYLNWLTVAESEKLKKLKEGGASLHELRVAIGEFYMATNGPRHITATKSLREGCEVFLEFLLGEVKAEIFIAFIEDAAATRQKQSPKTPEDEQILERKYQEKMHAKSNEIRDAMEAGFRQDLASNFMGSCVGIFDAAFRENNHKEKHEEV